MKVLVALACALCLAPASALAAEPANDDFADREVLSEPLPIEITRSNVEATKENEESLGSLFAAGHSVWFEWEAPSDGWFTIGSCTADFVNVVGVYEGTAVNTLTRVAGGNDSEGPHCPFSQREYTFNAVEGTKYQIVVDGNPIPAPEAPPPDTEGTFKLRIEATPPPLNDDFADSATLVTSLEEEFEGKAFYFGSAFGANWNATRESGEPSHVGGSNGASVWYSWTAPVSGEAKIGSSFSSDLRMGIYRGDSLESLQLLFGGVGPGGFASTMVSAGTTYRIVVYGLVDESSSEVAMSSFQLSISMHVPVPVATHSGQQAAPDTTPPQTTIGRRYLTISSAKFWLSSTEAGGFLCRLDKAPFKPCRSPRAYKRLKPGSHVFRAKAVDAAGNVDSTPAVARFKVAPRRR